MVKLLEKSPCAGLVPIKMGKLELVEENLGTLTLIAPYKGAEAKLSRALKKAHGLALPKPGHSTHADGVSAIWFGKGQALLIGPAPDATLAKNAALVDQSDGWAALTLSGVGSEDVMARLVPVDMRASAFPEGASARSLIAHLHGVVTRTGPEAFLLMAYRSMAGTFVHDVEAAMESVVALDG